MPSRTVRLDADVYERQQAVKRPDEPCSEALDRLLAGGSLLDLVGRWSVEDVAAVRVTLDAVDAESTADIDGLFERR